MAAGAVRKRGEVSLVHTPVLLKEAIDSLGVDVGSWYVDATLGLGGHSLEILKKGGRVLGIDTDPEAIRRARERFEAEGTNQDDYILKVGNFADLDRLVGQSARRPAGRRGKVGGVIFDLGVSSMQLDSAERGFSFQKDAPLDMRMSPKLGVTASDLVNALTFGELVKLFRVLGEEKKAEAIAQGVIRSRPIETTGQLAEVVERAVCPPARQPAGKRRERIHPATRVFQALRMAVNDELGALRTALPKALEVLDTKGRMAVISFHSLEDRVVKRQFALWQELGLGEAVTKKPISPGEEEAAKNPRSRSAKMRVFEKR